MFRSLGGSSVSRVLRLVASLSVPLLTFCSAGSARLDAQAEVLSTDSVARAVHVYPENGAPDTAPTRSIIGGSTQLTIPGAIALDPLAGELFVAASSIGNEVLVFALGDQNDVTPLRTIGGSIASGIVGVAGLAIDPIHRELWISSSGNDSIRVFDAKADGDQAPLRTIEGPSTNLDFNLGIYVDLAADEVFVISRSAGAILVFDRLDDGDMAPIRSIVGASTLLGSHQWLFASQEHEELYITTRQGTASAILTFPRLANGDVAPIREVRGSATELDNAQGIILTAVGELLVANESTGKIHVFPRTADGDVAPTRTLGGSLAGVSEAIGITTTGAADNAYGFAGPLPTPLFLDGFESGDATAWSAMAPL